MKDQRLNRLLAAARMSSPSEPAGAMPGPLQTRILAHWRAGPLRTWSLAFVLRGGLALAAVLMLACIVWSIEAAGDDPPSEIALANYELRVDVMP